MGGIITATDTPGPGTFFYRAKAVDNGWAGSLSQPYTASILGSLNSGWSNTAIVGTAANATVSPTPLTFGSVLVNTTSLAQTVTVSNAAGAGTLAISGISITGANAGDFAQTTTCTSALVGRCELYDYRHLQAHGYGRYAAATLTIASSNPTALSVPLSGTGVAPVISPSNNAFLVRQCHGRHHHDRRKP